MCLPRDQRVVGGSKQIYEQILGVVKGFERMLRLFSLIWKWNERKRCYVEQVFCSINSYFCSFKNWGKKQEKSHK